MNAKLLPGALLLLALAAPSQQADADDADSLRDVMQALGAAKSKGEDAVHMVNMVAGAAPGLQIDAMQRYSAARADFNGFIESLITERDPDTAALSASYHQKLEQALQAEEIFLTFVQTQVNAPRPQGGKGFLFGDLLDGAGKLFDGISKIGDTAVNLHKEMTRESDEHRQQIEHELDGLRWQQFSKIQ